MRKTSAIKLLVIIVSSSILLTACTKTDTPTTTPPVIVVPEPLRIEKQISFHFDGSVITSDTTSYTYDAQGKVISKLNTTYGSREDFTYEGERLKSRSVFHEDGTVDSLPRITYSENGDTLMMDYTHIDQTGQGEDTVVLTYIFKDSALSGNWIYLHNYNGFNIFEKYTYSYNSAGDIGSKSYENLSTPNTNISTVTTWDDKYNPMAHQPRVNYLSLFTNFPLESASLHNPLTYSNVTAYEFEMTYNGEGYPLTVKNKSTGMVMSELIYNR